jgi:hypothetical protein
MVPTKRRTPFDDPRILDDWMSIHRSYTEGLRLSKRLSYYRLSEQSGCHWSTCRYWIESNIRNSSINRLRAKRIPYSESPRLEERRRHSRLYQHIRHRPDIYLKEVYEDSDTSLSLDEITLRLSKQRGILLRNKTLVAVVTQYEQKMGRKLLTSSDETPSRYYLKG